MLHHACAFPQISHVFVGRDGQQSSREGVMDDASAQKRSQRLGMHSIHVKQTFPHLHILLVQPVSLACDHRRTGTEQSPATREVKPLPRTHGVPPRVVQRETVTAIADEDIFARQPTFPTHSFVLLDPSRLDCDSLCCCHPRTGH